MDKAFCQYWFSPADIFIGFFFHLRSMSTKPSNISDGIIFTIALQFPDVMQQCFLAVCAEYLHLLCCVCELGMNDRFICFTFFKKDIFKFAGETF